MSVVYSMKTLMFDLTIILLPKRSILLCCLTAEVMYCPSLFTELKLSDQFSSYVQFYLGNHFPSRALAAHLGGKVNHLNRSASKKSYFFLQYYIL